MILVKNIRKASLRKKLVFLISFTMLVILFYCLMIFLVISYKNNKRDTEEYLRNSYYRKRDLLVDYLSRLDHTAYSIIFSNWVQRFMYFNQISSNAEFQEYQRSVTHFLTSLASTNDELSFVVISENAMVWSNNSLHYDTGYNIKNQPWYNELMEKQKYIENGKSELFAGIGDTWSMTMYYPIISYFNFSHLGFLALNITREKLEFLVRDISEGREEKVSIYDSRGNLIVSSNGSAGNKREPARRSGYSVFSAELMGGEWIIDIEIRHLNNPFAGLGSLNLVFLLLIPIIAFFIMTITAFSGYLTVPIVTCKNAMLEISKKNFGFTLENHYHDEIGELVGGFNDMSKDLALLIKENAEINALRREAEIDMLQQKVNPHFLFNTLEIISALILGGQNKDAVQVCEMLGSIYHYNMMNRKWVTLREECDYVKHYLLIIRHKMSDLAVFWDLDEEALHRDILKLSIQPLVENAVRHGLRSRDADACLSIMVQRIENKTEITVMDNGSGIQETDRADIEKTFESIRLGVPFDNPHVGIPNVYQRLYLEYGEAMEFVIESRHNYGTKIIIRLPAAS